MTEQLHTYTDTYQEPVANWELNELLRLALITSYHHDQQVQNILTHTLLNSDETWVITQYNIEIVADYFAASEMQITTQVIEANRFFVTRLFTVTMDGTVTHRILAQFAIINLSTRKMIRVPLQALEEANLIVPTSDKVMPPKPLAESQATTTQSQVIYPEDIDENLHVNNRVYLRWALAAVPKSLSDTHRLASLQIKYGSELRANDEVSLTTHVFDGEIYQTITNLTLTKDACYVKMSWEQLEGGN